MEAVTHLEKVITGEVSAVTHLEKVIAEETSAVTYTEKVIAGEAPPITHLQRVIAGVETPVTHLEHIWAGGTPTPTEHEYTGAVPYTFTADGTPLLDWYIKGNMEQSGTPTPSNPIQPSETGERTANLLNTSDILYDTQFDTTPNPPAFVYSDTLNCSNYIPVSSGTYLRTLNNVAIGNWFYEFDANKNYLRTKTPGEGAPMEISIDASYIVFNISKTVDITKYMFSRTSTALPYEPYGYKIPISSANTTTPVYFGEVESTRKIKKLVLTGEENFDYYSVAQGSLFRMTLNNSPVKSQLSEMAKCSHYKVIIATNRTNMTLSGILTVGSSVTTMDFINNDYNNATEFKAHLADQYAAGTPVTVWYVLANEETAVVNEPLRKIGDYADTLIATQADVSIPTNNGSTTIDIDTTLKPSEVYIKYMG